MNTEKVKKFVKEHKKEIIIGAVCAGIGVHYGKKHFGVSADEMKLVKELRTFGSGKEGDTLCKSINKIFDGSKCANTFRSVGTVDHVSDIKEVINDYYLSAGINPEVSGFVVFTK